MNNKKIILFTVILMIAISSLSMVSAGWFDSNNDASDSNKKADVRMIDSKINYQYNNDEVTSTVNIMDSNPENGTSTVRYSNQRINVNYTGFVLLNLTNLTDEQIKVIQEDSNGNNSFFSFTNMSLKEDGTTYVEFYNCTYTLNDKIMNITINYTQEIPMDSIDKRFPNSGTIPIEGGHFDLPNITLTIVYMQSLKHNT